MTAVSRVTRAEFARRWASMSEAQRVEFMALAEAASPARHFATPGDLAMRLDPMTIQTPALAILDKAMCDVRDAVEVMYQRRRRFAELVHQGVDQARAGEQTSEEIPSRGTTRLMVTIGPQEGKSSRLTRYGIEWLLRQFPTLRGAIVSYDGVNAGQFSYQIRADIELFNGVSEDFDLGLRLVPDEKAKGRWQLTAGGGIFAIGIGGGLTGRPLDYLHIDDPVKDFRAADSLVMSEVAWDWWQTVGKPRLAPWAPVVLVMTRWHEFDLGGRFLLKQKEDEASGVKNYDKWTVINIPAQADHDPNKGEVDILGREPGEFMVSARGRTAADWEAAKNGVDPRFWAALWQGRPAPATGDILLKQWWRFYDEVLWTQVADGTFRVPGYELSQSWDFAFRDTKQSDYVVGQLWAKKGASSYLVYQVRARLSFTATIDAVRRMTRLFPQARGKYVEAKANGDAVIDSLRHEIPGIIAVTPDQSKEARAKAITPYLAAGNVYLPSNTVANAIPELSWSPQDLITEATSFPNGAHDDQVDAMTQYLKMKYLEGGEGSITSPSRAAQRRSIPGGASLSPMQRRILEQTGTSGGLE